VATVALASQERLFPGSEDGAQQAAEDGLALSVGRQVTDEGLAVLVRAVLADETQTTLDVTLIGREEIGSAVLPTGTLALTGPDGKPLRFMGISSDHADKRHQSWVFGPLPPTPGELVLHVDGFVHLASPESPGGEGGPATRRISGDWTLGIPFDGVVVPAVKVPVPTGLGASFGKGNFWVDEVVQAPSGTLVRGRLDGFSQYEIQEFRLEAWLRDSEDLVQAIALRGGFGEKLERVEFRFAPTSGEVTLVLQTLVRPEPLDSESHAQVANIDGESHEIAIDLGAARE
jgi:hypothetical protein